jgi:hypothetical protein
MVNYPIFNTVIKENRFKIEGIDTEKGIQNFEEARNFLEKCTEKGKHTKQEISHFQELQKQNQEKEQFRKDKQK